MKEKADIAMMLGEGQGELQRQGRRRGIWTRLLLPWHRNSGGELPRYSLK